jgi:hypothetical protein
MHSSLIYAQRPPGIVLQALEADIEAQLAALEGEFEAERADVAATHGRHRKDMAEVQAAMQLGFHELESDVRQARAVSLRFATSQALCVTMSESAVM